MARRNGFRRKKILPLRKSDANTYFRGIHSRYIGCHRAPCAPCTTHLSARSGVMYPGRAVIPEKPRARVHASPATPWSWYTRTWSDWNSTQFSRPSFWGRISSWPNLLTERYSIWLHGNAGVKFDSALVSWLSLKFQGGDCFACKNFTIQREKDSNKDWIQRLPILKSNCFFIFLSKLIRSKLISLCFQATSLEYVEITKWNSPLKALITFDAKLVHGKNHFVEAGDNLFQQQLNNALSFDAIWIFTSNVVYK